MQAPDQAVEVERLDVEHLPPAERQELARELARAPCRVVDLLELGAAALPHAQQLAVAQDDGEQVVEVVGDAAGQAADAFELLRLQQLRLQLIALGAVPDDDREQLVVAAPVCAIDASIGNGSPEARTARRSLTVMRRSPVASPSKWRVSAECSSPAAGGTKRVTSLPIACAAGTPNIRSAAGLKNSTR